MRGKAGAARPRWTGPPGARAFGLVVAVVAGMAVPLSPSPSASAETLRQALASAYGANPRLDAERARLRAVDEEVPRALSGYRPRITGSADAGLSQIETTPGSTSAGKARPWGYSLTVSQPVFNGLRTANAVDEAEAQVRAGREQLRGVEQEVLLDAVTAFADVVRDGEALRLREANVAALSREVSATQARQAAREVTLTDVAQARARLARALALQDLARGNLKSSRAAYKRVVGHPPAGLVAPTPPRQLLPRTIEEALAVAERENPGIVGALYRETADRHGVARIRSELLPEVRLEANFGSRHRMHGGLDEQETASVTGRLSMPLYEGGETYARVRQAKHRHVARLQEVEQARQETQAAVTQAWSWYQATRGQLRASRMGVDAARTALDGVRMEERAGQRTVLDLLNAEQELLDAEVQVVNARRELVVAAYTLIAQTGRLTATELSLADPAYDAEAHYLEVRNRWFGLDITRPDGRTVTMNVAVDGDPAWSLDD